MALEFVTKDEAYAQLQLDSTAYDPWLAIWIPAVSAAVLSWLKEEWRCYVPLEDSDGQPFIDSNGDPIPSATVLPLVKAAVLVELAQQRRFTDGSGAAAVPSHWGHGFVLGAGATSLLAALRKSTVQ
jgi:hypothetical protein